jgi:hypothetical protein
MRSYLLNHPDRYASENPNKMRPKYHAAVPDCENVRLNVVKTRWSEEIAPRDIDLGEPMPSSRPLISTGQPGTRVVDVTSPESTDQKDNTAEGRVVQVTTHGYRALQARPMKKGHRIVDVGHICVHQDGE